MQTTGVVFKIYPKTFPPKGGKPGTTWYSIKLDGNDTYFRCKANNPGDIEGKTVTLTHDPAVDGQAQVTDRPVVQEAVKQPTAVVQGPSIGAPLVAHVGQVLGSTRESSIHYQSARKDALQLVDIITRVGAVKLPAKEAAKLEAVEALVDSYTAQYFNDISTFGAVSRANGSDEVAAKEVATAEEEE